MKMGDLMYIFVVKELLKLIWFSIIKKLLPMSQNTCYLSPQSIHPLLKGCMGWTHRLQTFGDIGNTFCILMAAFLKRRQPWDGRKLPLCLNELNLLHWLCRKAYVFLSFVVVLG